MSGKSFDEFGFDPQILKTLAGLGFDDPTPIQAAAITPLMEGRDVIGRARTGSGKTAAFGLPIIEKVREPIAGKPPVRVLVLAPTRELAVQVTDAIRSFARGLPVRVVTIYGGTSYRPQFDALSRGVSVVVGTPGRLIDHLERGSLDLSSTELVVVDEADEMLRMGFIDDVERLLGSTPEDRQVALFSATMPPAIRRVADKYLNNPLVVQVEAKSGPTTEHIQQRFMQVPDRFKLDALCRVLQGERREAALVFVRTRKDAATLAEALISKGIAAEPLHGDLSQPAREQVLRRLRAKQTDCVVATDVAARGIDVQHISHVINVDLPENADGYAHRIGRTGRAGREGQAITFVTPREMRRFHEIRKRIGTRIREARAPSDAEIARSQRSVLWEEIRGIADGPQHARALHWVDELVGASDWSPHDIAAAVLGMMAAQRGLTLDGELDDHPPQWSQPVQDRVGHAGRRDRPGRPDRNDRNNRQLDRGGQDGLGGQGGGQGRPDRSRRPAQGAADEMTELFLAVGQRQGVRPGDLVGAFANELGVPGNEIGRITIAERKSFINITVEQATRLLKEGPVLNIRGVSVRISQARTYGGPKPFGQHAQPPSGETETTANDVPNPSERPPWESNDPDAPRPKFKRKRKVHPKARPKFKAVGPGAKKPKGKNKPKTKNKNKGKPKPKP
jgi:ATP-dependent RNA helicase DeaD